MKRSKSWYREYVKRLEEKLHSGEPYIFVDRHLLIIFLILSIIIFSLAWRKVVATSQFQQEQFFKNKILKITFFDVRQGDSALIEFPSGKNLLIDAGPKEGLVIEEEYPGQLITEFDAGERVILPYIKKNKIILEGIIVTHPHSDHFGGVITLFENNVFPKWFMDNSFPTSHPEYLKLLDTIKRKNIKYLIAQPQSKLHLDKDVECEILAPLFSYERGIVDRADNNSSIVLKLTYKNISILFTGDIETFAELDLLELKEKLKSTVLKVPHHGSFTSTTVPFLDSVSPEVAIISCGRGNPFGHPHDATIETLNAKNVKIYRTDWHGNIEFYTDGEIYRIKVEKE